MRSASRSRLANPSIRRHGGQWGRFQRGPVVDVVVDVGLVTYGIVYLLVAVIAAQMAVTGQNTLDSPYAALDDMAESVSGEVLLWLTALGLMALTAWRATEILWRDGIGSWIERATDRIGSAFSGIGYFALAVSAVRVAIAGHDDRTGKAAPRGPSLALEPWAVRLVVIAAGVVLFAIAAWSVYVGVRALFVHDLKPATRSFVVRLGQAGYVGRGLSFAIIGGMLVWTAVGHHVGPPDLRTVFRLVNISPTGEFLLWVKAVGLGLFGAYCLAWAANRRR